MKVTSQGFPVECRFHLGGGITPKTTALISLIVEAFLFSGREKKVDDNFLTRYHSSGRPVCARGKHSTEQWFFEER